MTTFTEAQVTEALEAIVAEAGEDFVYKADERRDLAPPPVCSYFEDGEPSCIVGHLFDRLGLDSDELVEGFGISEESNGFVLEHFNWLVTEALDFAQESQDAGDTWGEALKSYKRSLGER